MTEKHSFEMRKISLLCTVFGMALLITMMVFLPYREIEDASGLKENQRVVIRGIVDEERAFEDFRMMEINGVKIVCEGCASYLEKNVKIYGRVSRYKGEMEIIAIKVMPALP